MKMETLSQNKEGTSLNKKEVELEKKQGNFPCFYYKRKIP